MRIATPLIDINHPTANGSALPGLLSNLGHAFVGPLLTARTSLSRAAEQYPDDAELQQVGDALDRASLLMDGVARLSATERCPLPVDVPLDAALRAALRRVARCDPLPEVRAAALPVVHADEDHLTSMLAELLGNVARHAGPGATVVVGAGGGDEFVRLSISDDGPGLPFGLDPAAPAPFRPGPGGGAGCGLAVVAALAVANGGSLRLGPAATGGVRADLTLPVGGTGR